MIIGIFIICDIIMLMDVGFAFYVAKKDYEYAEDRAIQFRPVKWGAYEIRHNLIPIKIKKLEELEQ